jgi:hypothetical protein
MEVFEHIARADMAGWVKKCAPNGVPELGTLYIDIEQDRFYVSK